MAASAKPSFEKSCLDRLYLSGCTEGIASAVNDTPSQGVCLARLHLSHLVGLPYSVFRRHSYTSKVQLIFIRTYYA